MQVEKITSKGQLIPLIFSHDAIAATQTDFQLVLLAVDAVSSLVDGYTMPFAGSIVAVTADIDTAATAGSLTVGATIGGTEDADTTLTITTETTKKKVVGRYLAEFTAGAIIGAEITSSGTWNATTSDLVAVVWVLLQMENI